jgi:YNFM family putative membrane transporter
VASSWVGLHAHHAKAQAAALYLFFYYIGSSVAGAVGGFFWGAWRWTGVAEFVAAMLIVALLTVGGAMDAAIGERAAA